MPSAAILLDAKHLDDPYPFFAALRREAPVWEVAQSGVYWAASWRAVEDALARPADFSSNLTALLIRSECGDFARFEMASVGTALDVLATSDDPQHARERSLVQPQLKTSRLAALAPWIAERVRESLDAIEGTPRIEWTEALANRLPMQVVAKLLGLPPSDAPQLARWAFEGTELLSGLGGFGRMAELGESAAANAAYLSEQIQIARARGGDDLLCALLRAAEAGEISEAVIMPMLVQLTGAGGESTASLIGNAARVLAEDSDLQAQLRAEPALVDAFIEEVLRLESPFKGHYRITTRDTELGGVALAKGTPVLLLWASANRDESVFERADHLDLARPRATAHLAFGRGLHFCVGAALARLEATTALRALLARTREFALDPEDPPRWTPSLFVRRHARLPLRADWLKS
jgi:cytochrome P450